MSQSICAVGCHRHADQEQARERERGKKRETKTIVSEPLWRASNNFFPPHTVRRDSDWLRSNKAASGFQSLDFMSWTRHLHPQHQTANHQNHGQQNPSPGKETQSRSKSRHRRNKPHLPGEPVGNRHVPAATWIQQLKMLETPTIANYPSNYPYLTWFYCL